MPATRLTVVVGVAVLLMAAVPVNTLHMPVPVPVGVLAEIMVVGVLMQSVWLLPATEASGKSST